MNKLIQIPSTVLTGMFALIINAGADIYYSVYFKTFMCVHVYFTRLMP